MVKLWAELMTGQQKEIMFPAQNKEDFNKKFISKFASHLKQRNLIHREYTELDRAELR